MLRRAVRTLWLASTTSQNVTPKSSSSSTSTTWVPVWSACRHSKRFGQRVQRRKKDGKFVCRQCEFFSRAGPYLEPIAAIGYPPTRHTDWNSRHKCPPEWRDQIYQ